MRADYLGKWSADKAGHRGYAITEKTELVLFADDQFTLRNVDASIFLYSKEISIPIIEETTGTWGLYGQGVQLFPSVSRSRSIPTVVKRKDGGLEMTVQRNDDFIKFKKEVK